MKCTGTHHSPPHIDRLHTCTFAHLHTWGRGVGDSPHGILNASWPFSDSGVARAQRSCDFMSFHCQRRGRCSRIGKRPLIAHRVAICVHITPSLWTNAFFPISGLHRRSGCATIYAVFTARGSSSVGRASRSQRGGREFESLLLHHFGEARKTRLGPEWPYAGFFVL